MKMEMYSLFKGVSCLTGKERKKAAFSFFAVLIALGAIGEQANAQGGSKGHPWPSEYVTKQIDAMTMTGTDGESWMFRRDQYIRYSTNDDRVHIGPKKVADGWPGLAGTGFDKGINAISHTGTDGEYWMFRGEQYIRYSTNDDRVHIGPKKVADGWPGLAGTGFDKGINAISRTGTAGEYWMFKGGQYIRYSTNDNRIHVGPKKIADGWPGLRSTTYVDGIDAMSPTGTTGEYWMFRGDSYVRYSTKDDSVHIDKAIVDGWKGLDHFLMSKCVGP
ncbi:hemopexin repeat-containing protein [Alcanivoracaceae bacterium MT1]